jgi:hypothetical protein
MLVVLLVVLYSTSTVVVSIEGKLTTKYCLLTLPTGVCAIDAHFAFLAFQLFLMLSTSLDMTHMQYN